MASMNQARGGTMAGLWGDAHSPMTWSGVKAKLAALEAKELLSLVGDLYRLSKENQAFLDARCAASADPLQHYKKIISDSLYPDVQKNKPIQIAKAKRAVSDYKKAAADPQGEVELMVYFVEQGNDCTLDYGDIDGPFYDALILMYGRAVDQLLSLPKNAREPFRRRLAAILNSAAHIGWAYPDELRDHYKRGFGDQDLDD